MPQSPCLSGGGGHTGPGAAGQGSKPRTTRHTRVPAEHRGSCPRRAHGTSPQREGAAAQGGPRREWLKAATALLAVCSEPRRTVSALRSPEFTRSLAHPKPLIGGQAGVGGKGRAALPLPHLRASGRGRG